MAESLRDMIAQIIDDPEGIKDLGESDLTDMKRKMNPAGGVIRTKESHANISVTNYSADWLAHFQMVTMIGFISRLAEDYEPEEELRAAEIASDAKFKAAKTDEERAAITAALEKHKKEITKVVRQLLRRFINWNFKFNPDRHVRSTRDSYAKDREQVDAAKRISEVCLAAETAPEVTKRFMDDPAGSRDMLVDLTLGGYQAMGAAIETMKASVRVLADPVIDLEDKKAVLVRETNKLIATRAKLGQLAKPLAGAGTVFANVADPPMDVLYTYKRYQDNHFEQLRDVVAVCCRLKPDIEFAVTYYSSHADAADAKLFRTQHRDDFRLPVFCVENAGTTLLGPFNTNRSRIDFYNKDTEILKRMADYNEAGQKLSKDLIEKTVRKKKTENIRREGPDAAGLKKYQEAAGGDFTTEAKKVFSKDDEKKAAMDAAAAKADAEIPPDAIAVDMFLPETNADGEIVLTKKVMYTQAEAPLHMQRDSEYLKTYQPKRGDGETIESTLRTQTVTGADGKSHEVTVASNKSTVQ